ncbi:hypothetical protein RJT34_04467 [Clitoria ternatea]|uniref:Uncharacterized protein n=1 Tax=Clitoria ternatea TaxID=43366 RepID=A0AAN9Q2N8_CLITE
MLQGCYTAFIVYLAEVDEVLFLVYKVDEVELKHVTLGLGLPIPIGPHKGTGALERFHIAEPKGSTSLRDRNEKFDSSSKASYFLFSIHQEKRK